MQFAKRRHQIDSSGIRRIFDLAANLTDPCNLSIGLPDYDVPEVVKDAAIEAIRGGKNRYTLTAGTPPLRQKIREMYVTRGQSAVAEDVIVTAGTSGALFLVLLALLDPGDEVMMADPFFVMYKHLSNFIGAVPRMVNTYPDFRMTRERLEAAYTPRCKMLIINSPNNPTGRLYSREEMEIAGRFADEKGMVVLHDEIYEHLVYEDSGFISGASFSDPARTVVVSGLSKSVAMTGWRLGWCAGPKDLIKAMSEIQQYSFVCAAAPAQEAAQQAGMDFDMAVIREQYGKRRDLIYNGLLELGYEVERPGGAFYIYPKAPGGDGDAFVEEAIRNNLLIVPGSVFSEQRTHFRISFAASESQLQRGLGILSDLLVKIGA